MRWNAQKNYPLDHFAAREAQFTDAHHHTEIEALLFEALHSQEPRGYVVGWIIAISLLVGILIFLLLAVLLWKMGFFRRRYRDIIEAEKNRKDSDESWDWMDKDH
ncbi:unnamed protein product [Boreogadus saida]